MWLGAPGHTFRLPLPACLPACLPARLAQDMEHRRGRDVKAMEVLWRGSGSLQDATVFTGNLPSGARGGDVAVPWQPAPRVLTPPRTVSTCSGLQVLPF